MQITRLALKGLYTKIIYIAPEAFVNLAFLQYFPPQISISSYRIKETTQIKSRVESMKKAKAAQEICGLKTGKVPSGRIMERRRA